MSFLSRLFGPKDEPEYKGIKERWQDIERLMESDTDLSWKVAVLEADKLMDSALKQAKMRGNTMGERLRFAVSHKGNLRSVWEAHNLRNELAHNTHYRLEKSEAKRAIGIFKDGLKTLGAI
jgi:hypothetical protein